ncbi:MAG: DoxX family protein [Pyrinomonadaceae bacterium]|nr:DoxX family protein [Pyrinomonadaceae bacterium]
MSSQKIYRIIKEVTKYLLALAFIGAGANHFINTAFYLGIMPPYIPFHLAAVYVSGVFQIIFGALLLIPKYQKLAALGLILILIAVFPANVYMAMNTELYPQFSPTAIYWRLPVQAVLILWAFWYTKR